MADARFERDYFAHNQFVPLSIFDPQTMAEMPLLRLGVEDYRRQIEDVTRAKVLCHGPIPIKLRHYKANRFSDHAFEFFAEWPEGPQSTALEQIEDDVFEYPPFYAHTHQAFSQNVDELESLIGKQDDFAWINEQLDNLHRYNFLRFMLDNSNVVEYLKTINAQWSYLRNYDRPLLILPDDKLAVYLKLTYS